MRNKNQVNRGEFLNDGFPKNQRGINSHHQNRVLETRKKKSRFPVLFLLLIVVVAIGSFWYFKFGKNDSGDNMVIDVASNRETERNSQTEEGNGEMNSSEGDEQSNETENEIPPLGDFWLEINTDNLKIKTPVVHGITPQKLELGAGRHKTSALPSDETGNMVISGHRWKEGGRPADVVFEDLDKLQKGDIISIHYKGMIYDYEVTDEGVVDDDEHGYKTIMAKTKDKILTLYTCTPKYTSLRRLYKRAKFVSERKDPDYQPSSDDDGFIYDKED